MHSQSYHPIIEPALYHPYSSFLQTPPTPTQVTPRAMNLTSKVKGLNLVVLRLSEVTAAAAASLSKRRRSQRGAASRRGRGRV